MSYSLYNRIAFTPRIRYIKTVHVNSVKAKNEEIDGHGSVSLNISSLECLRWPYSPDGLYEQKYKIRILSG